MPERCETTVLQLVYNLLQMLQFENVTKKLLIQFVTEQNGYC